MEVLHGDLRYEESTENGLLFVTLRDADDGDVIVLGEDAIVVLLQRLQQTATEHALK